MHDYAEDLRGVIKEWRWNEWRSLPRSKRSPASKMTSDVEATDDLVRCAWVLVRAFGGSHHVRRVKVRSAFIEVLHGGDVATQDSNLLTRLVVFGHDAAVRVEVAPAMRDLRILLHPRVRTGSNMHRHPTIEEHIGMLRVGAACPAPVPSTRS